MAKPLKGVHKLGIGGIVTDLPAHTLPPNVMSAGHNIRFFDGYMHKTPGWTERQVINITPIEAIFKTGIPNYVYLATSDSLYRTDGVTVADISNTGGHTGALEWQACVFGDAVIWTNNIDTPQYIDLAGATFADLPNWPTNTRAKVIKPFKNFLVAGNIQKPSGFFPSMIKWSHPADNNALPQSWDETDPTTLAGELVLDREDGVVVDMVTLGDSLVVYTNRAVYLMNLIGGTFVFSFRRIFDIGLPQYGCVVEVERKHYYLSEDDLLVHDGASIRSYADLRVRNFILDAMDRNALNRMIHDEDTNEIWFCSTFVGKDNMTHATAYNYRDNTWSSHDLPECVAILSGRIEIVANTWTSDDTPWLTDFGPWSDTLSERAAHQILYVSAGQQAIYTADDSYQQDGVNYNSWAERTGLDLSEWFEGQLAANTHKTIKQIWPQVFGQGQLEFKIGGSDIPEGPITWQAPVPFEVGVDRKVDCRSTFRYLAWRVESKDQGQWKLTGFDVDLVPNYGR